MNTECLESSLKSKTTSSPLFLKEQTNKPYGDLYTDPEQVSPVKETIDHPSHYGGADNPYEHIKVVEALKMGYHDGQATKYIFRAVIGGKGTDPIEDIKKARWYLDRWIQKLERERG
jgi:hypothetical protein